jgi:hypothetical protein
MAQTNYTPISLYYSATASATPTAGNLVAGELALNTNDGKLYYKDSSGVVQTLASKAGNVNVSSFSGGTTGLTPNTATTGAVTLGGTLNVANGGTGLATLTTGYIPYGNGTSAFSSNSALSFSGTSLTVGNTSNVDTSVITKSSIASGFIGTQSTYTAWAGGLVNYPAMNIGTTTNHPIIFGTNALGVATIDTSGNFGLGVTPSVWSLGKVVEVGYTGNAVWSPATADFRLMNNAIYTTGPAYKYANNGYATMYQMSSGTHQWNIAPSSTSGSNITFTQAMTLNNSGQLGIGTTSPSYKLDVSNNTNGFISRFTGGASSDVNIGLYANTATAFGSIGTISNHKFQIFTNGNDVAIFDTSGNLGLGVTPSAWNSAYKALEGTYGSVAFRTNAIETEYVNNTYRNSVGNWIYKSSGYAQRLLQASDGSTQFLIGASGTAGNTITFTQAMTLDNTGTLFLAGTGSPNGTTAGVAIYGGGYSYKGAINAYTTHGNTHTFGIASASGTETLIQFQYSSTAVGSITSNGTTTSYNVTSDQRLKTNIIDAPAGNIDDIKVRSFDFKSDGSHQTYGFIAQELVEVAPYAVYQPTNPEEMMAVDYSKLVPMMIKEIQDLKQRILTLENK